MLAFVCCLLLPWVLFDARPDEKALLKPLAVELRSGDKWVRKGAVEKLAQLELRGAWELLVGALEDPRGEVADMAQLLLGDLPDPAFLDLIEGRAGVRAKDPWVRLRVAEALGRMDHAEHPPLLGRLLRDGDPRVRRTAAWSVERLARAELLGPHRADLAEQLAGRWERERDAAVRARVLLARAAVDPAAARAVLTAALGARDAPVRCAAVALVPELTDAAAGTDLLSRSSADPDWTVRNQVTASAASIGTPAALAVLVERLAEEKEERLLWRLVERLQAVSGMRHRRDPRPWRHWLAGLPPDWTPPGPDERDDTREERERSQAAAGLPIRSGRFALLIDLSGSIWVERSDGTTRKSLVDQLLREALEGLPVTTRFNLIPFTGQPHPWQDEIVPATPKNVRAAIRYFERCNHRGTGNFWDAAMLALEDPEVDTILVLTDGEPTGGRRHVLELMMPLFVELAATHQVAVDSVLVDSTARLRRRWGELSERTAGESIAIDI